jgi:hypothetical protein
MQMAMTSRGVPWARRDTRLRTSNGTYLCARRSKPHQQNRGGREKFGPVDRPLTGYRRTSSRVEREGDHLSVQENDEPKQNLMPESETDFSSTRAEDSYTFEINGEGKATTMILRAAGKVFQSSGSSSALRGRCRLGR